jgi:hypothetical protein
MVSSSFYTRTVAEPLRSETHQWPLCAEAFGMQILSHRRKPRSRMYPTYDLPPHCLALAQYLALTIIDSATLTIVTATRNHTKVQTVNHSRTDSHTSLVS